MNFRGTTKIGTRPITATLDNGNDVAIAAGCVVDLPSTNRFIKSLEAQGYIERAPAEPKQESKTEES